jgi:hypothetical protein
MIKWNVNLEKNKYCLKYEMKNAKLFKNKINEILKKFFWFLKAGKKHKYIADVIRNK